MKTHRYYKFIVEYLLSFSLFLIFIIFMSILLRVFNIIITKDMLVTIGVSFLLIWITSYIGSWFTSKYKEK